MRFIGNARLRPDGSPEFVGPTRPDAPDLGCPEVRHRLLIGPPAGVVVRGLQRPPLSPGLWRLWDVPDEAAEILGWVGVFDPDPDEKPHYDMMVRLVYWDSGLWCGVAGVNPVFLRTWDQWVRGEPIPFGIGTWHWDFIYCQDTASLICGQDKGIPESEPIVQDANTEARRCA